MVRYKTVADDGECVFCKIAHGEIEPRGRGMIWEDEKYIAWLSPFPNVKGFTVLIPKKHYGSDVLKMPDKELQDFIIIAKKVSELLLDYFEDVGRVGLIMEGTGIDHAHIKLSPMHGTGYMKKGEWKQILSDRKDYFEEYQGYLISSDGPQTNLHDLEVLAKNIRKHDKDDS